MDYDLSKITPDIRYLNDVKSVLHDKKFSEITGNFELYFMYRGLEEKEGLRYDITVIPEKMLGDEFIKTKGHYHVGSYGELYTVLDGTAIYLMQKRKPDSDNEIEDVYFVKAKKGDVVIIPQYYGHITINPSESENLKMVNWVSKDCKSDYSLYEKFQGACYFFTKGPASAKGSGEGTWIKNENYKSIPELREEKPTKYIPEDLSFLK